jgi:hypothetical protein
MSTGQPLVNRRCGYRRFSKRDADLIETAHNITSCPHVRSASLLVFGNDKTPVRSEPEPALLTDVPRRRDHPDLRKKGAPDQNLTSFTERADTHWSHAARAAPAMIKISTTIIGKTNRSCAW